MMRNNNLKGLAISSILFLLAGCAATTGSKSDMDQIESSGTKIESSAQEVPEQDQEPSKRGIQFKKPQGREGCLVEIPYSEKLVPDYDFPRLSLSAEDGSIDPGSVPSIPEHCPIDNVEEEDGDLLLTLSERTQFMLSSHDDRTDLVLTPSAHMEGQEGDAHENSVELMDLSLESEEDLEIALTSSKPLKYRSLPRGEDQIKLEFPKLHLPEKLEGAYDLTSHDSPAQSMEFKRGEDGGTELLISLEEMVPYSIDREDNKFLIEIHKSLLALSELEDIELESPDTEDARVEKLERDIAREMGVNISGEEQEAQVSQEEEAAQPLGESGLSSKDLDYTDIFPGLKKSYSDKTIDIDMQNAKVEEVLRIIAEIGGYNLLLGEDVDGEVSVKFEDVPWDQALDLVLMQKKLGKKTHGNMIRVATTERLKEEQEEIIEVQKTTRQAREGREEAAPLHTGFIQVNYASAPDLKPHVEEFLEDRGSVTIDERTNKLIVKTTQRNLDAIEQVVEQLDTARPQVVIEAKLVYATDSFQRSLGLKWGGGYSGTLGSADADITRGISAGGSEDDGEGDSDSSSTVNVPIPGGDPSFGIAASLVNPDNFDLDVQLQMGEEKGQVKTISSPRILALNNQDAKIEQGTRVAINKKDDAGNTITEYENATLELSVVPRITPDNRIIMELDISDDSPGTGDDIDTRETQTTLMVDNQDTVVLGGVQRVNKEESRSEVQGLANIPLLGHLFKNRDNSRDERELLIFIKPKIKEP